jgi:hypothetical protein
MRWPRSFGPALTATTSASLRESLLLSQLPASLSEHMRGLLKPCIPGIPTHTHLSFSVALPPA